LRFAREMRRSEVVHLLLGTALVGLGVAYAAAYSGGDEMQGATLMAGLGIVVGASVIVRAIRAMRTRDPERR
jgi:hypothetical protein